MVDYRKIRDLEDDYDSKLRSFRQEEESLDDFRHQFQVRTDFLIEQVYEAYKNSDSTQERNHFIYLLQDNRDMYHREYLFERERIDEMRQKLRRDFDRQLDEEYRKKDDD